MKNLNSQNEELELAKWRTWTRKIKNLNSQNEEFEPAKWRTWTRKMKNLNLQNEELELGERILSEADFQTGCEFASLMEDTSCAAKYGRTGDASPASGRNSLSINGWLCIALRVTVPTSILAIEFRSIRFAQFKIRYQGYKQNDTNAETSLLQYQFKRLYRNIDRRLRGNVYRYATRGNAISITKTNHTRLR